MYYPFRNVSQFHEVLLNAVREIGRLVLYSKVKIFLLIEKPRLNRIEASKK